MIKKIASRFGSCFLALFIFATLASAAPVRPLQTFTLKDYIGQDWKHDVVTYDLAKPLEAKDRANVALIGPDGQQVPYQVSPAGTPPRISFLADLPSYGESRYQLLRQKRNAAPEAFQFQKDATFLQISNGLTGVRIPTAQGEFKNGPLLALQLKSGVWIGSSRLTTKRDIESYASKIAAAGPVYVDIECRYAFAGGKNWVIAMRLIAGEPVVLIHETFNLDDDSQWEFSLGPDFKPNHVFQKCAEDTRYSVNPIKAESGFIAARLCPWVAWWDRRNASFFGLLRTPAGTAFTWDEKEKQPRLAATPALPDDDMLIAAAGDVATWARSGPEIYDYGPGKGVPVVANNDGQVSFQLQLAAPGRRWLLGAGSAKDVLVAEGETATPQKLLNRFCETSLDAVKDMPLTWKQNATFPRLIVTAADVKKIVADPTFDQRLALNPPTRDLKKLLLPVIAGQPWPTDKTAREAVKAELNKRLDVMMSYFRYGNNNRNSAMFGTLVPRVEAIYTLPRLDLALGTDLYTPAEKERIFAQLAFIGDKIYSPDYISPGRSFAGNPNMVTAWCGSLVLLACMLPDHPYAAAWYKEGMGRIDYMLEHWQGPNGAWLEAPHYMMVAIDPIFMAKSAAANAGFSDGKLDEKLIRTVTFLAKISTPGDPRFQNRRHYPPLGNTYLMETSGMFGAVAKLYKQADPEQAAALQWMWQEQGKPHWIGLGGEFMLNFYKELMMDEAWTATAPNWKSEAFPGFGAVLRSGFPGDRETYMVYHQGEISNAHYDRDQGSFEMWAKGRPLSLDWGYHGQAPAYQHNRMEVGDNGKVLEFAAGAGADYLHGQQDGGWNRQIIFMKDADPLGPNYFVMRDSTKPGAKAGWWLWINTRKDNPAQAPVQIAGDIVKAEGEHDVDLDVWFAPPSADRLKSLEIKQETVATVQGTPDGNWSSWDDGKTTQHALHINQQLGEPLVSVLYPHLRNQPAAAFASLADGKVIKVTTPAGEDYIFLSLEPFKFEEGNINFSGTAGAIQVRGKQVTLTLGAAGELSYGKARLSEKAALGKTFTEF